MNSRTPDDHRDDLGTSDDASTDTEESERPDEDFDLTDEASDEGTLKASTEASHRGRKSVMENANKESTGSISSDVSDVPDGDGSGKSQHPPKCSLQDFFRHTSIRTSVACLRHFPTTRGADNQSHI